LEIFGLKTEQKMQGNPPAKGNFFTAGGGAA
jgi:hypothetical protein